MERQQKKPDGSTPMGDHPHSFVELLFFGFFSNLFAGFAVRVWGGRHYVPSVSSRGLRGKSTTMPSLSERVKVGAACQLVHVDFFFDYFFFFLP